MSDEAPDKGAAPDKGTALDPLEPIPLDYPIQAFGKPVAEIKYLRRPNAGDLIDAEESDHKGRGRTVLITSAITGIPVADLRSLDVIDFAKVDQRLILFFKRGRKTGP